MQAPELRSRLPRSKVVIKHVDVVPSKRELYQPYVQRLAQALKGHAGLEGFQVWTWNSRPNHWTVFTVWRDARAADAAQISPELMAIWDQIYEYSASPNNQSIFRRFDLSP